MSDLAELEIHHINVSQGDSTLIIIRDIQKLETAINNKFPSTKPTSRIDFLPFAIKEKISLEGTVKAAMLIDAGEYEYGDSVAYYLNQYGVSGKVTQDNFFTVATHFHSDHVHGFRNVFFKDYNSKKKKGTQKPNYPPKIAYDCGDHKKWDNTTRKTYLSYINRLKITRKVLNPLDIILLGQDSYTNEIRFRCIASNGSVSKGINKGTEDTTKGVKSPDQNARSIVLVLEYGDFRYFLGGDIGGTGDETGGNWRKNKISEKKSRNSNHPDVENEVTKVLPKLYKKDTKRSKTVDGHVCCFFVNHHGSSSSNDVFLIEQMKPKIACCSAGFRTRFHYHPTQEFFQRIDANPSHSQKWQNPDNLLTEENTVDNTIDGYYITEMVKDAKYGKGKSSKQFTRTFPKGKILGDIIVRPTSDINPIPGANNTIKIQVYGTGDLTDDSVQTGKKLRDTFKDGHETPPYPIGPFTHTCDLH